MKELVLVERETHGLYCHPNCAISYIHRAGECVLFDQHVRWTPDGIMRCTACVNAEGHKKEGGQR